MKSIKKTIMLVICALALITTSVFGTLAYLTDTADVLNTFTVGNVSITLDETVVLPDGTPVDEDQDGTDDRTDKGNEYHLIPNGVYTKDPTVTVLKGSDDAYVRMKVTVTDFADVATLIKAHVSGGVDAVMAELANWLGGWDPVTWVLDDITFGEDSATLEFRYKEIVDASEATEDVKLAPLFTTFHVPEYVTGDELATLDKFTIAIEGDAIQAAGFDDAEAAWDAFDAQTTKATESTPAPVASTSPTMTPPAVNP